MPCSDYKTARQRKMCYATDGFKRKPRKTGAAAKPKKPRVRKK